MSNYANPEAQRNEGSVTCNICAARYTVTGAWQLWEPLTPMQREHLLLNISRFCYRCRRPACPDCWDRTYALCAACVQEAGLVLQVQERNTAWGEDSQEGLVCREEGRYHREWTNKTSSTHPTHTRGKHIRSVSGREVGEDGGRVHERTTQPPVFKASTILARRETKPGEVALDEIATLPGRRPRQHLSWVRKAIFSVGLILLALFVGGIIAAMFSMEVNTLLWQALHIDVRGYMAAFWNWLQHPPFFK
jgi:hypothetical protein